jgi:methylthioribose-1-phosphate isomerase
MDNKKDLPTLYWQDGILYLLDQRLLPHETIYRTWATYRETISSIREMSVRGAPAIGIAAAFGMALAANEAFANGSDTTEIRRHVLQAASEMRQARPTAVNLAWATERVEEWLKIHQEASSEDIYKGVEQLAHQIHEEDKKNNRLIGQFGADLLPRNGSVLTHCNAGALATGGYGTALGVIRAAFEQGKNLSVYVSETRPLLQGARITAFELIHEGIPETLVTDNCAGHLMKNNRVDLVVVGADRIAGNGDSANKIGTYSLAVLAKYHNIPFYIAAPLSTIDQKIKNGSEIIIEERNSNEITHFKDQRIAPQDCVAYNPAFDVTPAKLISAIITEKGVMHNPDRQKIAGLFNNKGVS